jgi:hypothetical protein
MLTSQEHQILSPTRRFIPDSSEGPLKLNTSSLRESNFLTQMIRLESCSYAALTSVTVHELTAFYDVGVVLKRQYQEDRWAASSESNYANHQLG